MNKSYIHIHIDPQDTIADICSYIDTVTDKRSVLLIVQKKNIALENYMTLRILLARFPGAKFAIISSRSSTASFARLLGIGYYENIQDIDLETYVSDRHIRADNFTIWEYILYTFRRKLSGILSFLSQKSLSRRHLYSRHHLSWYIVFFALFLSIVLISSIFYLSVPKAIVTIRMQQFVRLAQANISFQEEVSAIELEAGIVPVKRYPQVIEGTFTYAVSSFDTDQIVRAKGKIEIQNTSEEGYDFLPGTRFVTDDGVIFLTTHWIQIAPWSIDSPSRIIVSLEASEIDTQGENIGARGNISEEVTLTIPWLSSDLREKVIGVSVSEFSGWTDTFIHQFTQEEYDKLSAIFLSELRTQAEWKIRDYIREYEKKQWYELLPIPDNIPLRWVDIISDTLVGAYVDEVQFSGTAVFDAFLFHVPSVTQQLTLKMSSHLLENLEYINTVSQTTPDIIEVFDMVDIPFSIRATTSLPVSVTYALQSDDPVYSGLAGEIAGLTTDEAKQILASHPYVSYADIKITPFWRTSISQNIDNISFRIDSSN